MNRLGQNDFSRRPPWSIRLVNGAFAAKMDSHLDQPNAPLTRVCSIVPDLHRLLTIQAANSAYRASCPTAERKDGSDGDQRPSGAVGAAHQDAMAPGTPA